jgi:hypothetical protein
LWTIEPLSVGLALLVFGLRKRSTPLVVIGAVVLGLGIVGLIAMTALISLTAIWSGSWLLNLFAPLAIMAAGLLILILSLLHRTTPATVAAE